MEITEIIAKVKNFVEEECKKPTSKYGYEVFICHFVPMVEHARRLAREKGANIEVVEIAAWLHDIGSIIHGRKDHHITGAKIAEEKLEELGYEESKIEMVKKCIISHRGSLSLERSSIEEQIIADADALSAFDNVSGLFKAAIFCEGHDQIKAREEVRKKLQNSWVKLSDDSKKFIQHKYLEAMILLGEK